MKYLLDTCILSEIIKPRPHESLLAWMETTHEDSCFSVLTLGELKKGFAMAEGKKKLDLDVWIQTIEKNFEDRIIDVNVTIANHWGKIQGKLEKEGRRMSSIDALIAATASVNNLVLVTRNIKDMERSGAKILNPWDVAGS